VVYHVKVRNT